MYSKEANQISQPFILPSLPYSKDEFGDYLSKESFEYHYEKHHMDYVNKLNKLLESNSKYSSSSLEDIITKSHGVKDEIKIFNNASQIWNHSFYWNSISSNSINDHDFIDIVKNEFGSIDNFKEAFINCGLSLCGSGWVWLVINSKGGLEIMSTSNVTPPFVNGYFPLITCDVWEHAYYIDYRNKRADFLKIYLDNLVNYDFAYKNYFASKENF